MPGRGIGIRMDVEQFRVATQSMRLPYLASLGLAALVPLVVASGPGEDANTPWKRHPIDRGLSGGDGVRLDDADGDGDLDISVGWEQSGISRLYLNPGAGKGSRSPWPTVDVGPALAVEDAVMADVDSDGRMDVISSTEGRSRSLFVHFAPQADANLQAAAWTTLAFPKELAGDRMWMFATTFDVNEDGHLDIIAAGKGGEAKIAWFEAPPTKKRDLWLWRFHAIGTWGG